MTNMVLTRVFRKTVALSIVALMLLVPTCSIITATANPIAIPVILVNQTMALSENLTMPYADVDLMIIPEQASAGHVNFTIDVSCEFLICCNATQQSTVAFAYPMEWDELPSSSTMGTIESSPFTMTVNGSEVDYLVMTWDEVSPSLNLSDSSWYLLEYQYYAAVNISFVANSSVTLGVDKDILYSITADYFEFHYYVGTAASWSGDVFETISLSITDTTLFENYSYNPTPDQVLEESTSSSTALWELTSFPYSQDKVGASFTLKQDPFSYIFNIDPGLVAMAVILSILVVIYTISPLRRRTLS
jgi:hypothetical protein